MRRDDDSSDDWHLTELTDPRELDDINDAHNTLGDYDPDDDSDDDSDADCHCGPAVPLAILLSMLLVAGGVALAIAWFINAVVFP